MKRDEVTTPLLEHQLCELESTIAISRKRRRNLLRVGHLIARLETHPELWFRCLISFTALDAPEQPVIRASVNLSTDAAAAAQQLLQEFEAELGPPLSVETTAFSFTETFSRAGLARRSACTSSPSKRSFTMPKPDCISTLNEHADRLDADGAKTAADYRRWAAETRALTKLARDLDRAGVLDSPIITSDSASIGRLNLHCAVPGFTSLACPELAALLELIIDTTGLFPRSFENPDMGYRSYDFGPVVVIAALDEAAAEDACLRQQVGMRTERKLEYVDVEVPVFAFKC